jgi:uncharacterized membrane protein
MIVTLAFSLASVFVKILRKQPNRLRARPIKAIIMARFKYILLFLVESIKIPRSAELLCLECLGFGCHFHQFGLKKIHD